MFSVIVVCSVCLSLPIVTKTFWVLLLGFCIFETAIGAYFPIMMRLRSDNLGDEQRAAVTSLFRVCIVVFVAFWILQATDDCFVYIGASLARVYNCCKG